MRPSLSRNATRSSPSSLTRTGGLSGSAISHDRQAGIQYRRIALPIGVPAPTRVTSSFSFGGSIDDPPGCGVADPPCKGGAASGLRQNVLRYPGLATEATAGPP